MRAAIHSPGGKGVKSREAVVGKPIAQAFIPAPELPHAGQVEGFAPAGCRKCGEPLQKPARGPMPTYCSVGCRRAAEFEIKRVQEDLISLEAQLGFCQADTSGIKHWPTGLTSPERVPELQRSIAALEARFRDLLDTPAT